MNLLRQNVFLIAGSTFVSAIMLLFISSCGKDNGASQTGTTPETTIEESTQSESGFDQQAYQKAKDEAMTEAEKEYKARLNGAPLPPSEFRFPNTPEPEQRIPNYLNFYYVNDHYPTYLLCEYRVNVKKYDESDEPAWFEAALKQVRDSGPTNFPPIQWVAVIIANSADWETESTFEQAYKVGAIFKASDVLRPSCDLSQLVAHAALDRHPFKYDTSQPTAGDQQRWLIVEQHAATNNPTTGPK
jgi:hypothetical protein